MPLNLAEIEAVFFALSHEARRHIVMLLGHSGGELPSGYLAKRFPHSWPTTTRHLKVLEEAGVVQVTRKGRGSLYRLDRERVQRVLGEWLACLDAPTPTKTWGGSARRTTAELGRSSGTKPNRER